jgi:DNA-binding NarL/FixJ family response regulator
MQSLERTKVGISHQSPIVAAGLVAVFSRLVDFEVTSTDGISTHSGEGWQGASVVILDYWQAVELMANWKGIRPKIIIASTLDRETEVRDALETGIEGYVLLDSSLEDVIVGVRRVSRGGRYVSPEVACRIADGFIQNSLTAREIDVLHLVASGCCNKSIAKELDITVDTVKSHVKSILAKLRAESRTHAVAIANERGIIVRNLEPIAGNRKRLIGNSQNKSAPIASPSLLVRMQRAKPAPFNSPNSTRLGGNSAHANTQ